MTELHDQVHYLESHIGGKWIGVKFNPQASGDKKNTAPQMRICEAIKKAANERIILPVEQISCLGGQYSVGALSDDKELIQHVCENNNLEYKPMQRLIRQNHTLQNIQAIEFGDIDQPDVIISYCTPYISMQLIRLWQTQFYRDMPMKISTFLATCSSVLVKAYTSNQICLSMGCATSREMGLIAEDQLVIGIPCGLLKEMIEKE